jgi:transcriptional regulator with XRE-family HTH domain
MILSSTQCKAARAMLNWTLDDTAGKALIGRVTICRFENEEQDATPATRQRLRETFEKRGLQFTEAGVLYPPEWNKGERKW